MKFPSTVYEKYYKDPQLDNKQKARDLGTSKLNWMCPSNASPQGLKTLYRRGDRKIVRTRAYGEHQGNKAF